MSPESGMLTLDMCSAALTSGVALGLLRFWEETAKRRVFEQSWPSRTPSCSSSSGCQHNTNASLGTWNMERCKSMSREGDYRELLKGPLYYAFTITLSTSIFWRTSPIAIAAICNLCAGDGVADIAGRRFGQQKLPYNPRKSFAGTIAMAVAGFLASIGYMHYFASFGFIEESWSLILSFLLVSVVAAVVESLPVSSELDDNLTVPLACLLLGAVIF